MRRRNATVRGRAAGLAFGLAAVAAAGCDSGGFFCGSGGVCGWSDTDVARVAALANLPSTPPVDDSNVYATNPDAIALGKMFYFDTRFSGPSTWLDGLNRTMPFGRTAIGQGAGVACVSCHDAGHGGVDAASAPGDVSVGSGWTYNNSLTTFNSAFYLLHLWNGRADSLWAQAVADNENGLTTNGNRLQTAWIINDHYSAAYQNVFSDPTEPLPPFGGPSSGVQALVDATGQCPPPVNGMCLTAGCRAATTTATSTVDSCWPQIPLHGKPGKMAGCQPGLASEPFGDAWDCMDPEIQTDVTRMLVDFGKAIAAYEGTLILGPSQFDQWAGDLQAGHGDSSAAISDQAKLGAQLFVGKAGCSDCHNTPLLSDSKFHNVGVGQVGAGVPTVDDCPAGGVCDCAPVSSDHPTGPKNCLPFGATDGLQKLQANGFLRSSVWSDDKSYVPPAAPPDYLMPSDPSMRPIGGYRTPSLRNVSLTAPYMHDGSIATLADVVWHYNQGISDENAPGAPAASFRPLYLSDDEQAALVAFLESLDSAPPPAAVTAPPTLP
ncbi:MAG TPA: cytochrome c peroxidase [Polyangia bacterium]|jgi:cytochrome c peroxidase|nr:cytochrome c peroxidase [Polyangia bacterium]